MGSTPLTLAALATSAVSDLVVTGARDHTAGGNAAFLSAVLSTPDGEVIVRIPRNGQAEATQAGEILGLSALTDGARARLPFQVPRTMGQTRAGNTRAVVSTFLPGQQFETADLAEDALLLEPLAQSIAAVHALPTALIREQGLPVLTESETRAEVARFVDRAVASRLVPSTVADRWQRVLETQELWQFVPVVVHGSLDADRFIVQDERVSGLLGWSALSVGDPAQDLSWLAAAGNEVLEGVLARYARIRDAGDVSLLRARALFLHELEVARWLLHGVQQRDQTVIDDAVSMLDGLVDRMSYLPQALPRHEVLDVNQVSSFLDEPRPVSPSRASAAADFPDDEELLPNMTDVVEPLGVGLSDAARPDAAPQHDPRAGFAEGALPDLPASTESRASVTAPGKGGTGAPTTSALPTTPESQSTGPQVPGQQTPGHQKPRPGSAHTADQRTSEQHDAAGQDASENETEAFQTDVLPEGLTRGSQQRPLAAHDHANSNVSVGQGAKKPRWPFGKR